ncbi:unnamed protein product, partial [Iphiclides podalirius]
MTRLYVKFIMLLATTSWGVMAMNCVTQNKNKVNEAELLHKDATRKPKVKSRSRCCPYDFDPNDCKVVGERLLCGYNRNIGGYPNENFAKELENGCRIRNGRLECGYVVGPFTNPRRPPVDDVVIPEDDDNDPATTPIQKDADKNASGEIESKEPLKHFTAENSKTATTRCLEIRERIVCRHL